MEEYSITLTASQWRTIRALVEMAIDVTNDGMNKPIRYEIYDEDIAIMRDVYPFFAQARAEGAD